MSHWESEARQMLRASMNLSVLPCVACDPTREAVESRSNFSNGEGSAGVRGGCS